MKDSLEQLCRSMEPICLSGGAPGSDLEWGKGAKRLGHKIIHWTFADHKSYANESEIIRLGEDELHEADPSVQRANNSLGRRFPARDPSVNKLLRRNWYQVKWTDSLYAVSHFKNGVVDGGTAWAVQMYIDRFLCDLEDMNKCKIYVFDQMVGSWYSWNGVWNECDGQPPTPSGVWGGIGTRKLNNIGLKAICAITKSS